MRRNTYWKRIGAALLMLGCWSMAGCSVASLSPKNAQLNVWYTVSGYIDGDTFKIKVGDSEKTIRLLYVDTPELGIDNMPEEPFAREASDFTKQALADSGQVRLTFDKELIDKYERTLAVVELKDGRILNESLLEEGLAKVLIVEPNVKMENVYKQTEQTAKQAERGIWSTESEKSNRSYPVKKAEQTGIELKVDKQAERVTISNTSDNDIALGGWKLVSVRGNQTYEFETYALKSKSSIVISSGKGVPLQGEYLQWSKENVWSNNESDPAELYNAKNELVAVWEDQ